MITIFIGQRGTGKSTLLKRVSKYLSGINHVCFDLDHEIETREGQKIDFIFSSCGEKTFRALENKYFHILLNEVQAKGLASYNEEKPLDSKVIQVYIAVGGGFEVNLIPSHARIVYLKRSSDSGGRIFLDRPTLEFDKPPLEEYLIRYEKRKSVYSNVAWEEYLIPEGIKEETEVEKQILVANPDELGGVLTLLPRHFNSEDRFLYFIKRRLNWKINYFEVRDDLLSEEQIRRLLGVVSYEKILFARRKKLNGENSFLNLLEENVLAIDYDRELLTNETVENKLLNYNKLKILSVHEYRHGESLESLILGLEIYETKGFHIKLAVEINNFTEFLVGHQWQSKNPNQRSFLPRSKDGKWLWYRLWKGNSQIINFFKEGDGSAPDQPSLYQWIQRKSCGEIFAALLGSPVAHSFTPQFQGLYFEKKNICVLPIKIEVDELAFALSILKELGLIAAAVTSPLKLKTFDLCKKTTDKALFYKAVNTIVRDKDGNWFGHNTDELGLIALSKEAIRFYSLYCVSEVKKKEIIYKATNENLNDLSQIVNLAVWGGGGTLSLMKQVFKKAEFFSIQSGLSRDQKDLKLFYPEIVIWAAGRLNEAGTCEPPLEWNPKLVVDLNYRDDSGGKELAKKTGAKYLNGEIMFYAQGLAQQSFWTENGF